MRTMNNPGTDNIEQNELHAAGPPFRRTLMTRLTGRLGITINTDSVTICLAQLNGRSITVKDIQTIDFTGDTPTDWESILDRTIGAVYEYQGRMRLEHLPVNIGILGHDIAFRRMYLPSMPASELRQAVMYEGEKLFPFPFNECNVHYEIADKIKRDEISFVGINIVAAKSYLIDLIYEKFHSADIAVGQVNYLPAIVARAVATDTGVNDATRSILLHLDDKRRSIAAFIHNGYLEFLQEFMTPLFLDDSIDTGITNLDAVIAEFQSFQDLFIARSRASTIDSLFVSGPLSDHAMLLESFSKYTGLQCQPISAGLCLQKLAGTIPISDLSRHLPTIAVACASPKIHPLAPPRYLASVENRTFIARISAVAALAILTTTTLHMIQIGREKNLESQLIATQTEIQAYESSAAYQSYINLASKLYRGKSYLKIADSRKQSHFHVILTALSQNIPAEVNFTDIQFRDFEMTPQLLLMGNVRVDSFSPEIILAQYVESLRELPFFRNITVTNHYKQKKDDRFDLNFQIQVDTQI